MAAVPCARRAALPAALAALLLAFLALPGLATAVAAPEATLGSARTVMRRLALHALRPPWQPAAGAPWRASPEHARGRAARTASGPLP